MKKILFLVAIIGALVSCSENETSSISPDVSNNLIRFNTLRDKVITRYANDNKSDYQVYALITDQTARFTYNVLVP